MADTVPGSERGVYSLNDSGRHLSSRKIPKRPGTWNVVPSGIVLHARNIR
jgi:hypothetical protein